MQTMFVSKKWQTEMRNKVKQSLHGEIPEAWCEQQYVSEEANNVISYESCQDKDAVFWPEETLSREKERAKHMRSKAAVADAVSLINSYKWSIEADILPDDDEQSLNNCQNSPETYLSFWNVEKICDNITNTWRT